MGRPRKAWPATRGLITDDYATTARGYYAAAAGAVTGTACWPGVAGPIPRHLDATGILLDMVTARS